MDERGIDAGVIEACRQGDRGAFRLLFDTHKDRVYSIALHHLGGDTSAAAEVTQQVFIDLFRRIGQFRGEAEFTTWLHRLVVNACLDEWRRRRRLVPLSGAAGMEATTAAASPLGRLVQSEIEAAVREAVRGLRPKIRLTVLLKYFLDLSYEEMAKALGCSKGTVASRLNAGHRILARRLTSLRGAMREEEPR